MFKMKFLKSTVTDTEMRVCVNPGGNGVTMNRGVEGGPGLAGSEISSQLATVEVARRPLRCLKIRRMGLVRHQDPIMHRV
jgi:hypothetical protein